MTFMRPLKRIINATFSSSNNVAEPGHKIFDLLGLQDPPTKRYYADEVERMKLTPLGENKKNGLAEYAEPFEIFTHTLTVGKTGIGKTTYFMSSYLFWFIAIYKEASVVILDAMDGVIEQAIALCERSNRRYVVLPDHEMNLLNLSGNPHEVADKFGQVYIQNQVNMQGDASHYHKAVKNFCLLSIPLFYRTYGRLPILQELLSLASEKEALDWMLEDAPIESPERREYFREFGKVKYEDLRRDLHSLRLFIREITSGKLSHMLNQKDAPSLESLINSPERPVIIMRVGDYEGSIRHTLGNLAIGMISNFITNRDVRTSNHPCLIYIDEAGLMTSSASSTPKTLSSMLQTARKKRCGFVLGMQHIQQVPDEFRSTFIEGCNTIILHPDLPHETAAYFADRIGNVNWEITYTAERRETDGKKSTQVSREIKPDFYMSPDEIMNIAKDEVIVLKRHDGAKRTPLLLKKPPMLILDNLMPYIEPDTVQYAPPTIWEERGYYEKPTQAGKQEPSVKVKEGENKFLSEPEQKRRNGNRNRRNNSNHE